MTARSTQVRFVYNPAVEGEIAKDRQTGEALLELAKVGVEKAQAVAPVRTGTYRRSIHAEIHEESSHIEAVIVADDPKSVWIEFGTVDTPTFAPLRRGALAIGGEQRGTVR